MPNSTSASGGNYVNPNFAWQSNVQGPSPSSNSPSAINVNTMGTTQNAVIPPPQPTPDTGASANASITNPIPTTQDIINADTQATPTQGTQTSLLGKLSDLMKGKSSLSTLQTSEEQKAGVFDQTSSLNELNSQLEGLNNQATSLQVASGAGGTIENKAQESVVGRGVTSGGLAPLTASELRKNQIQQAGISAQSLTLKSAIYAATGKLNLAKAAADRAAQVQFDAVDQQVNYYQSLLNAIAPQLDKEQKAQAAQLQSDLAERSKRIDFQRESFKTAQGAIADALKNNPNNKDALAAAHQAANLNPNDPNYLQKVQQLVAPFASDVTMRALDIQSKQGQISLQKGQIAQLPLESALKRAQIQNLSTQRQDTYEQQFRTALEKEFSARSGSLGTQANKVDAAIHLRSLFDQYKDTSGNYQVPPAQYAELAQGMAALVSGNNSLSDSRVADIQSASAQGDLAKALQYATGQTYTGSSQAILKNLSDSIDRQGTVSENLRDQYVKRLEGLAPTGLSESRRQALIGEKLPSYKEALQGKYTSSSSSQFKAGDTQVKNGWVYQRDTTGTWKPIKLAQ